MEKETSFDPDIFDAVEFDDLESLKMYWRNDINIDYQDLNGMTLLMYAVSYDHTAIIEYLLSKNPDLGLRDKMGASVFDKVKSEEVLFLLQGKR
jgi:ankyrin repeat protein